MSYISQLPDFEKYNIDIKDLYYMAKERIDMLRHLRLDQESIRKIISKVFETNNTNKIANDLGILDGQRNNSQTYWLCRMALSSEEDIRWLIDRELICYLLSNPNGIQTKNDIIELTNQNVNKYFPEHLMHLLKMFNDHLKQLNPGQKLYIINDSSKSNLAITLQALQYSHLKSDIFVLNGYYITTQNNLQIAQIVSGFYENFNSYTNMCQRVLMDTDIDPDFRDLLLSIRQMKMSETTVFSDRQALQNGVNQKTFGTFVARGAVPPCSARLYRKLSVDGKLKHQERLQFYAYLRMVGMPVEDAVSLIRLNFCRNGKMTEDTFNKQYMYNIEHVYGLKGNRKGALCKSCESLSREQPGTGFTFGCPFSSCSASDLEDLLSTSIKADGVQISEVLPDILKRMEAGHPHAACQQLFKYLFGSGSGTNNPAHYTTEAIRLIKKMDSTADQTH